MLACLILFSTASFTCKMMPLCCLATVYSLAKLTIGEAKLAPFFFISYYIFLKTLFWEKVCSKRHMSVTGCLFQRGGQMEKLELAHHS